MSLSPYSTAAVTQTAPALTQLTGRMLRNAQRVVLSLGRYGFNAGNHGICGLEAADEPQTPAGNVDRVTAWLLRPQSPYCTLLIWRNRLPADREQLHFGARQLCLPFALRSPALLSTAGGRHLRPRPGNYPLRLLKDYYVLHLPLEASD